MKATAHVILSNAPPEVKLEHKGEVLVFSISVFGRDWFQQPYGVFDHINQYWDQLPAARQQHIFNLYKDIDFGFDNINAKNELFDYLTDKATQLIAAHGLEEITNWIAFKSDIIIPPQFEADYAHSIDNNTSREKTYTRGDYARLVGMSVLFRCVLPLWGQYISNTRQDTGNRFKEFRAFQLIHKSELAHCVPMEKLKMYVEHIAGDDKYDPNKTLNGINSEDFGYWLLGLICTRRMCLGDVRGVDPKVNLITIAYKYIIQKIRNEDSDFENAIKEKRFDDKSPDSENKISTLERYKIKSNISLGEIVELEFSMRSIRAAASRLSYKVDPDILERSLQTSQELMQQRLLDPQITLLRWLFKTVISPRGLMYLPKTQVVQAIGAMEAVLWARGHEYLAVLSSSYPLMSDKEIIVSPVDSKMRVPDDMTEELNRLYPFHRVSTGKKMGDKEVNLTVKAIDTMTDNLMMFSWRPTAHPEMMQKVFGVANRKLPIKPDIKLDLTRLVIELGSRTWS